MVDAGALSQAPHIESLKSNLYYRYWTITLEGSSTLAAEAPMSFKQGQVSMEWWNFCFHLIPVMTLSFRSRVTESTFSIFDTKYSSEKDNKLMSH